MKKIEKEKNYDFIVNYGESEGFEVFSLNRKEFIFKISEYLKKPKKIFLGMGDFLEIGDFNNFIDAVLLDSKVIKLEGILDRNNRKIAQDGQIPFSFFKLAVYYPDFLLKDVPVECISTIGRKGRLFPRAETFVKYVKEYDPLILTAIPYDISIEYTRRLGLDDENLFATEYKKYDDNDKIFSGDVIQFISGNRRCLKIEQTMAEQNFKDDEILYIGRGEAGSSTFSSYNSIAFNPPRSIIEKSKFSIYGSTLESLLVLFNFENELEEYLLSEEYKKFFPSMVVVSNCRSKSDDLIELESKHRQMQENIIGQLIEYSEDSYASLEREINVLLGASTVNMTEIRNIIYSRLKKYIDNPQSLVREVYTIAKERYKNFHTV